MMFKIKLSRPLPLTEDDEIIRVSSTINVYIQKGMTIRVEDIIRVLKKRYTFEKLINYFECFRDEI